MTISEALTQLGLNEKEAATYVAALERGESLFLHLAAHAGIKRPTLYEVLPRLEELGLIRYGKRGKRRTVIAQEPGRLLALQEERLGNLRSVLPELVARYSAPGSAPKVSTYDGSAGLKQIYEDILSKGAPIRAFVQTGLIDDSVHTYLARDFTLRRVRRRITAKYLFSGTAQTADAALPDSGNLRELRFVDRQFFPAAVDIWIYGDNVAYINNRPKSPINGSVVENRQIATTLQSLHAMAWEFARK